MSLRVWLPLNGNLNNQGASNCNPVQTTAPTYVNGKIGDKAMSTGAFYLPAAEVAKFYNNTAMSWCFWIYPTGTGSAATPIIGQSNMSAGDNRMFSIYQYPNAVDLHLSWQSNESNTTFLGTVLSNVLTANTWNHCAITYNGSIAKIYVNNILVGSSNGTSTRTNFSYNVPIPTTSLRYLNDLRIYDHCLSEKEIKEISKALICHYPLNGNGRGQDNYYINSNFYTSSTVNWYGVNGSSISTTVKDNKKVITATKGTSNYIFGQTITNYSYTANSEITFTISADIYAETSGTIYIGNWISTSQASGWQAMSYTEVCNTSNELKVGWNHVSITHKNAKNQYNGNIVTAFGYSSATYFATNIKFEFGDIDTPWCPNSTETIYTTLGYNSTTEIDTSGYKRNALIVSTTPSIESNSPKYNCSYKYLGSINNIYYNTTTDFNLTDNFSWSSWFKPNYTGTTAQYAFTVGRADAGGYGYGFQIMSSTQTRVWFGSSQWAWTTAVANNEWRHIVFTKNGTAINVYENGVAKVSATFGGTLPTYSDGAGIGIGGFHYSGGNIYPYYGNISDFRIYATALSTDDVKELYQSSASITNNGSILAYDFTEQ